MPHNEAGPVPATMKPLGAKRTPSYGEVQGGGGDIKLTSKVYTDETQLPIYDAIKGLPRLLEHTQIRAQILGTDRQNGAQPDAKGSDLKTYKTIENKGFCRSLAHSDVSRQMERAKGFETAVGRIVRAIRCHWVPLGSRFGPL